MGAVRDRILILCKTYPSPSGKYSETSCVAGINARGELVRLFPVPFRLIRDEQQFKKWQWVSLQFNKARKDRRPESHAINVDAIECEGRPLTTDNNWEKRRAAIARAITFSDFDALELNRQANGNTLALLRPKRLVGLDITPVKDAEWTKEELEKLVGHQTQEGLFDQSEKRDIALLRKLPYDFHYRYICEHADGQDREYRHKIVDWEAGVLFWKCQKRYGDKWERPFRQKLEVEFAAKDLIFLMGTIHRFPDKWLIVSLIYPPRAQPAEKTPDMFEGLTQPQRDL